MIAVSGGVDSRVLLDALVHDRLNELTNYQLTTTNYQLIVAHFDHGIRADSLTDEKFVRGVVGEYVLAYESARVELGPNASEAEARQARYKFLREVCKKYKAQLITAHHQGDVVETMLLNLLRGTGWRGLVPMAPVNSKSEPLNSKQIRNIKHESRPTTDELSILRPLLTVPKAEILKYANRYGVKWREDSTNQDQSYLRNYIRLTLIPKLLQADPQAVNQLLAINQETQKLQKQIATELQNLSSVPSPQSPVLSTSRYFLIMSPPSVARELIYYQLTQLDPDWHPSSLQLKRCLHFIKTGQPRSRLEVSGRLSLELTRRAVQFKKV